MPTRGPREESSAACVHRMRKFSAFFSESHSHGVVEVGAELLAARGSMGLERPAE